METHLRTELMVDALQIALLRRKPSPGLIHHSNQGVQYTSLYSKSLEEASLAPSMGQVGSAYDNSLEKSFVATLKTELLHRDRWPTREAARIAIFKYLEGFYNRTRPHLALDYKSPAEFERRVECERPLQRSGNVSMVAGNTRGSVASEPTRLVNNKGYDIGGTMQNANHQVQKTPRQGNKTLVAGWFSFEAGGATAGDLLAADLVCEWLERASCSYDVALAPPFRGGVAWRSVDPQSYSNVVFVCGPFKEDYEPVSEFLNRFAGCYMIGLNLSMLTPLDIWNPFDFLLERDSSAGARPDCVFLSRQARVPVVGVVLVEPYLEGATQIANAAIHRLVNSREMSVVTIDTRLDVNSTGLRSSAEIESLIARMDVVVTTRLHGMVFALKNGIPAVAIDPEVGGAKIRRQAETIGWPIVINVDDLTEERLQEAFDYCLTEDARVKVRECSEPAMKTVEEARDQFISVLSRPGASQRTRPVHGRRWLQEQWQGTNFGDYNFLQIWKLKNVLARERRKVQRLTQQLQDMRDLRNSRTQSLTRERQKVQRLTQQLQDMRDLRNSRTQRLLRKLGHIRVKVLKR